MKNEDKDVSIALAGLNLNTVIFYFVIVRSAIFVKFLEGCKFTGVKITVKCLCEVYFFPRNIIAYI